MAMRFDIVGSDDLKFPVTIDGSLSVKELWDKVQVNHQHVLSSIGAARSDFLVALRYNETHPLPPNEVIGLVLSNGDSLVAIWASSIARYAPGKHRSLLTKLAQFVIYTKGSFFCTLGIIDALAINSPPAPTQDKVSAPKQRRVTDAPKPSGAPTSSAVPVVASSGQLHHSSSSSSSQSSSSSASSLSSQSSGLKRAPALPTQPVTNTVHIHSSSSRSDSSSSSSSVSSASSSSSSKSSSSSGSSQAGAATHALVAAATPKLVHAAAPAAQPTPAAKTTAAARPTPVPTPVPAAAARKSAPAKVVTAAPTVAKSPAALSEKDILAQISTGVAIASSHTPKKRGARGGKNSASSKAKTSAST